MSGGDIAKLMCACDEDEECECRFEIWISKKARKAFEKAQAVDRARILRFMKSYCEDGRMYLDADQLKFEERFRVGTRQLSVAVYAWRAGQARIYGAEKVGGGITRFVCTEASIKKSNKANRRQLQGAADSFAEACRRWGE